MIELTKQTPKWIWYPESRCVPCTFVFFRKLVVLDEPCLEACGTIAADSRYQLFVNGERVQRGPAPFDPRYQELEPVDIGSYLRTGSNVIGVLVCYFGYGEGTYIPGNPGMLFQLSIKTAREIIEVISDEEWKSLRANSWRPGNYKRTFLRALQESFDARLYPVGWNEVDFGDEDWRHAKVVKAWDGKPLICGTRNYLTDYNIYDDRGFELKHREIPFMKEEKLSCPELVDSGFIKWKHNPDEYFEAFTEDAYVEDKDASPIADSSRRPIQFPLSVEVKENQSSVLVFKLNEEVTGFPFIKVRAPSGTVIEILFSESRIENQLMLPMPFYGQWVRVITSDEETYYEAFEYEAIHYMAIMVRGSSGRMDVIDAGVIRRTYPFAQSPSFTCSDALINHIHAAGVNTCRNVCLETMVDNVARERQQYSGDVGLTKLALYLGFGEYRLPARMIKTYAQGQNNEGWFLDCFPASDRLERIWQKSLELSYWGPIVDHGIGFIFDISQYVLHSGEMKVLEDLYGSITKHYQWLQGIENSEGLLPVDNLNLHTVWIDHDGFEKQKHKQASLNIYYYGYLLELSKIAIWMKDSVMSEAYLQKALVLKQKISELFWDERERTFVDNLPWIDEEAGLRMHDRTISMALLFDCIPDGDIDHNLDLLSSCPQELGLSHPVNAGWRLWAMSKYGKGDRVVEELRTRWGGMASLWENNTFSETWAIKPEEATWVWCCSAVAPLYILYGEVLGIKPLQEGFKTYSIRPQVHDIQSVTGTVYTPNGEIQLKIVHSDRYLIEFQLPEQLEAVIDLPSSIRRIVECDDESIGSRDMQWIGKHKIQIRPVNKVRFILELQKSDEV